MNQKLEKELQKELEELENNDLTRTVDDLRFISSTKAIDKNNKEYLVFGTNNYLGLTHHPQVIKASMEANEYGTGSTGSRLTTGASFEARELENNISEFKNVESTLIFNTGYMTNLGVIYALTKENDVIFSDQLNHASIIDGTRISKAKVRVYKHKDTKDLENLILDEIESNNKSNFFIVSDGVFSMEGDLADLPGIVALKNENCSIMVDEAHGLGVLGDHGRGVCNHYGLTGQVDIIMGTFSKSLAAIGGFIAADASIINWVRHHSRSYIFSASNTPAATAAARAALQIMKTEPERIAHLWELTDYALNNFRQLGFEIGKTSTPIIPLYIRDFYKTFFITKMLFEEGVFVNPVIPPACAPEDTLIRFSLMATHTKEQIDIATEKLVKCFKAYEILK